MRSGERRQTESGFLSYQLLIVIRATNNRRQRAFDKPEGTDRRSGEGANAMGGDHQQRHQIVASS